MDTFYIQTFAALHKLGMFSFSKGFVPWNNDQSGSPLDVLRWQVYAQPHVGFGKLNVPERLAFSTAALTLNEYVDLDPDKTGISLGTVFGSISTDLRYMESVESGFPSPAYFTATLPSSAATEVAIMFKLKGPDRIFVGNETPGLTALENALTLLKLNKASSMLVLLVNGIDRKEKSSPFITLEKGMSTYCYGLLLTKKRSNHGINYRIELSTDDTTLAKNSQQRTEESYFFDLINAMMKKRNIKLTYSIGTLGGSIVLTKER